MRKIILESPVGPEITVWGKRYLFFGGTDYLGMAGRPEVLEGARKALDWFGISSSGSRTSTGTNELHLKLEAAISRFAGSEDTVLVSSGYLSMAALIAAVCEQGDLILIQDDAHSSIRDAVAVSGLKNLDFSLRKLETLDKCLDRANQAGSRIVITVEGVSPLFGTVFPLPEVLALLDRKDFLVLIDDAHAFGVLGEKGRGTAEFHGYTGPRVLSCSTLSKAFGSFGGCVPGTRALTSSLRKRSLAYNCSTPPPAPVIGAALAAFEYVNKNTGLIARLRENACFLKEGLAVIGLPSDNPTVPIAPLYFNEPEKLEKLSQKLLEEGILAPLVNYPGSPDGGLIRLAVSAAHSQDQISRLLECLKKNI